MYKNITTICLVLIALLQASCTADKDMGDNPGTKTPVTLQIATRGLADNTQGVTINSVRFVAVEPGGTVVFNAKDLDDTNTTDPGIGRYVMSLKPGYYEMFAVVNETAAMAAELDAATTRTTLQAIKVASDTPFAEANVVLMDSKHILLAAVAEQKAGKVSVDGGTTMLDELEMKLLRAHIKTTLNVRKKTLDSADEFTIKTVGIAQAPKYGWLLPAAYDGATYETRTLYNDATGIAFTTNTDAYTSVVTDANSSNIFPEYILADPTNEDQALYYVVSGEYKAAGAGSLDVYYKFPLRRDLLIGDYDLPRNIHFKVDMTITKRGEVDAIQINYTVTDWEGRSLDVDIDDNTFLDVTNVEVSAYDAAATRIYFYTNKLPADRVYVRATGITGAGSSGSSFEVKDIFYDLTDGSKSCLHYDPTTGQGYIDLINLNTDLRNTSIRKIYLHAGQLEREITVTSIVSEEASKKTTTTYVGTFHRNRERGERIVTWHTTGDWTAEILPGLDADKLRIDRIASPAYLNGQLYTKQDIAEAEGAQVTDGITRVQGRGRVYFRVGWDDFSTEIAQRYAKIRVTYNDVDGNVQTKMLYCRQGEEPDRVVSQSTRFATYNIGIPQAFVKYPSMSGYLYQWNRLTPWMPTGIVNNFPNTFEPAYDDRRYACPPKYAYPDEDALEQMGKTLTGATYRWGYYADGYFDRRAISNHSVTGPSGEIATAGGLFFLDANARGIFLPSAGYRNETGAVNGSTGFTGRYWSEVPADITQPTHSQGLQITASGGAENKLDNFDRREAFPVRCMRLEGNTIIFSANGGDGAPRPITALEGTLITVPDAPTTSVASGYTFFGWKDTEDGSSDVTYKSGSQIQMFTADKILYAVWLKGLIDLSTVSGAIIDPSVSYNDWTGTVDAGTNGSSYWELSTVLTGEKAYPLLLLGEKPVMGSGWPDPNAVNWATARTQSTEVSAKWCPDGWRLPRASEAHLLCTLMGTTEFATSFWTATEASKTHAYVISPYSTPLKITSQSKENNAFVRCVKEVR